jgi:hypothetical protein
MAWDTDATWEKLLDAAITEFSERGFARARIDHANGRTARPRR